MAEPDFGFALRTLRHTWAAVNAMAVSAPEAWPVLRRQVARGLNACADAVGIAVSDEQRGAAFGALNGDQLESREAERLQLCILAVRYRIAMARWGVGDDPDIRRTMEIRNELFAFIDGMRSPPPDPVGDRELLALVRDEEDRLP